MLLKLYIGLAHHGLQTLYSSPEIHYLGKTSLASIMMLVKGITWRRKYVFLLLS
jgi:hypothetical protein